MPGKRARVEARALRGAIESVAALRQSPGAAMGLVTGNFEETGSMKLRACGIDPSWFVFSGWEGDCSGTGVCQVSMDKPKTVIAHFQAKT